MHEDMRLLVDGDFDMEAAIMADAAKAYEKRMLEEWYLKPISFTKSDIRQICQRHLIAVDIRTRPFGVVEIRCGHGRTIPQVVKDEIEKIRPIACEVIYA